MSGLVTPIGRGSPLQQTIKAAGNEIWAATVEAGRDELGFALQVSVENDLSMILAVGKTAKVLPGRLLALTAAGLYQALGVREKCSLDTRRALIATFLDDMREMLEHELLADATSGQADRS